MTKRPDLQQLEENPTGLPCFHADPSGAAHCTLSERHRGHHYHWPSKKEWPSRGPQPSALRKNT